MPETPNPDSPWEKWKTSFGAPEEGETSLAQTLADKLFVVQARLSASGTPVLSLKDQHLFYKRFWQVAETDQWQQLNNRKDARRLCMLLDYQEYGKSSLWQSVHWPRVWEILEAHWEMNFFLMIWQKLMEQWGELPLANREDIQEKLRNLLSSYPEIDGRIHRLKRSMEYWGYRDGVERLGKVMQQAGQNPTEITTHFNGLPITVEGSYYKALSKYLK